MIFRAKSKEVAVVRIILLLALVLATITFIQDMTLTGLVTSENQTNELPVWNGNTTWQINKNSNLTVDLNNYFLNSHNLTYLGTVADKIRINLIDNLLTVIPSKDFVGERTILIIASDEINTLRTNIKLIIGTDEERALSPINESVIEEVNITQEINITEVNATQIESNASAISALETEDNRSIKKFDKDEKIKDENNKHVGKKVEDETMFETFFTKIQKNETELLVEFYHDSTEQEPVWIEGDIGYELSKDTAEQLENITLIVPRVKGIVPKFKLHIGTDSDVFEFGKTIPDVIFNGESTLIDRDDEKIDIELIKDDSKAEIKGAIDVEFMNAKVTSIANAIIKTDVFAANNVSMDNAVITVPKIGNVNVIMECSDFNLITDSCPSTWTKTDIPFSDNGTHITFTVDHFSGYGGAEINILNVQSYPVVGGEWTVEFTTTGIANLTISAVNTTWSNSNENNDLKFLEIKCGDTVQTYNWINNKVFIENYNCSTIGYEKSKVLTSGTHILEFNFGGDIKYAKNYAQSYWSVKYNVTDEGDSSSVGDFGQQVVFDSNQDVIITGYSTRGTGSLEYNWFIVKYNSTGSHLWNQTINWSDLGRAYSLDIDSDDNITIVGDNGTYAAIAKYNSTGTHLWNKSYFTPKHSSLVNRFYDVDLDYDNNITAVGQTYSSGGAPVNNIGLIMRLDSAGTPLWNVSNLPGIIKGVGVDSKANIYAGSSNGTLYKYSSTGSQLWNVSFNVSGGSYLPDITDVAVDSDDNITVVGTYWNTTESKYVFVVDKYNSTGYLLWNYEYVGLIGGWGAYRVDTASNGEIAATGQADINNTALGKGADYFTIRLNSSGVQEWNNTYGYVGSDNDYVRGVAINEYGEIAVTGSAIVDWTRGGNYAWTIKYATLNNTGPTTQQVKVNQTSGGDLTCYAQGTDNEESTITAYYYWTYILPISDTEYSTTTQGEIDIPVNTLSLVSTLENPMVGVKYNCYVKFFDSSEQELLWSFNNYTRIPICGDTLNQNTENYLLQDATTTTDCFTLGGHNITLDCQGYAIRGDLTTSGDYAVQCNSASCGGNFTMRSCYVANFSSPLYRFFADSYIHNNTFYNQYNYAYFAVTGAYGNRNNITNNTFTSQRLAGASGGAALYLNGIADSLVKNNYFYDNAGADIWIAGNTVSNNRIVNNTFDVNSKNRNTIYYTATQTDDTATFENNTIINQGTGASSWGYNFQSATVPITFKGNNSVNGENMSDYFHYNKDDLLFQDLSRGETNVFNFGQLVIYSAENVTIKNNLLENSSAYEVYMNTVNNLSIINNTFNDGSTRTLWGSSISNLTMKNNTIVDGAGVYFTKVQDLIINNNTIESSAYGLNILAGDTISKNVTIKNNDLVGSTAALFTQISGTQRITGLDVYKNTFRDSTTGYTATGDSNSNNRFYDFNVYNNTIYEVTDGLAINNYYSNITNNRILNCTGTTSTYEGIRVTYGSNISKNYVTNCGVGISFPGSTPASNVYENNLTNNSVWGIMITHTTLQHIRQNILSDNLINEKPPYFYWRNDSLVLENLSLKIGKGVSTGVITVVDSKNVRIKNNTFASNGSSASDGFAPGIGIFNMSNSLIDNNTINSTEFSIEVHSSFSTTSSLNYVFQNNTIANNIFTNSTDDMLYFNDGMINTTIVNNTFDDLPTASTYAISTNINTKNVPDYTNISDNKFNDLTNGINFAAGTANKPNRMDIGNNVFTNIVVYAVMLQSNAKDNVVHDNNITNITQSSSYASGIYIYGTGTKNNTIRDNYINNTWRGINWRDTAANNTVYNNKIYNARDTGLYVDPYSTSGTYIVQNIYNNTVCYGKDAIEFNTNFGYGNTKTHNNTFCISNINPLNSSNTTDTQFDIAFNATNIFNETNTNCTVFIDNTNYGYNDSMDDKAVTNITMTSTVTVGWHNLSINCSDAHNNQHLENVIEFEILSSNEAPNTTLIKINSSFATNYTNENLTCWVNMTDTENSSLFAHFNWYNNSVKIPEFSGSVNITTDFIVNISTISSVNTTKNQNWTCEAKASDGTVNETDFNNASIIVRNTLPVHNTPILNSTYATNYTSENLTVYPQNVSDADDDAVTNITNWFVNNKSITVLNLAFDSNISVTSTVTTRDYSPYTNKAYAGLASGAFPTWVSSGIIGGAYNFTNSENDEMQVADNTTLDLTGGFTVELWASPNNMTVSTLIGKTNATHENFQIEFNSTGHFAFRMLNTTDTVGKIVGSTTKIDATTLDIWRHIVGVYDNVTNNMLIYIDGKKENEVAGYSDISDCVTNTSITIGAYYDGSATSLWWDGILDEIRIYNRALSAEQILALNNSRTDLIVSQETNNQETWKACITPNDGTEDGTEQCSNNLTIELKCGQTLYEDTTMYQNLNSNGTCFTIGADSITLNCTGYSITGNKSGYGINITRRNSATIKNCSISNFSSGINVEHANLTIINNITSVLSTNGIRISYGDKTLINNSLVSDNTNHGISGEYCDNNTIFNVTALANTQIGMYFSNCHFLNITKSKILNSTNNDGMQIILASNNSFIISNEIKNNYDDAIVATNLTNATIKDNIIEGSSTGRGINTKNGCKNNTIVSNTIGNCTYYGIENSNGANGNIIANNTIINCTVGISLYVLNDTIVRNNTVKSCAHGITIPIYSGARGIKISENTITDCHNKSGSLDTKYQALPAGIFIETRYYYNNGSANNLIYNNTIANNSRGLIVWVKSGSINISKNRFINNSKGAYMIMNGEDTHISDNTYINNGDSSKISIFEPTIATKSILSLSDKLSILKHLPVNTTLMILVDNEKNSNGLSSLMSLSTKDSSGATITPSRTAFYAPGAGTYDILNIAKEDDYNITISPLPIRINSTEKGTFTLLVFVPTNITVTILPLAKSAYTFIKNSNITVKNEIFNANNNLSGIYIYNSSGINFTNVSILNSKDSYIINALNNTLENTNLDANVIIQNTDYGEINFTQDLNITTAQRLLDIINITQNKIYVDTVTASEFNKSAVITIKNLTLSNPEPIVNFAGTGAFVLCNPSICNEVSYANGTFIYNVTHFTEYGAQESKTNITVNKTQSNSNPNDGHLLNYTVTITVNASRNNATNITVYETYDTNTTFINASPTPDNPLSRNNTWSLGNLSNSTIYQVNITVRVNSNVANGTEIINTVNVTFFNITGGSESSIVVNLSAIVNASIIAPKPSPGGGSSGGGTPTIGGVKRSTSYCNESWTCGFWSSCIAGERTRICMDQNNCGTENNKPSVSMTCEEVIPIKEEVEEEPKTQIIIVEEPKPISPPISEKIINAVKFGYRWILSNICFILTLITYILLILAALFAIMYFVTRNYFENINKYIIASYVLVAVSVLFLMIKYAICKEILMPAFLAIAGIIGVFVLDVLVTAIVRQGIDYWKNFRYKEVYQDMQYTSGRIRKINKHLAKRINKFHKDTRKFKKTLKRPKIRFRDSINRTLDDIYRFNHSLKQKAREFHDKLIPVKDVQKVPNQVKSLSYEISKIDKKLNQDMLEEIKKIKQFKKHKKKSIYAKLKHARKKLKNNSHKTHIRNKEMRTIKKQIHSLDSFDKEFRELRMARKKVDKNLKHVDSFNNYLKKKIKALKK